MSKLITTSTWGISKPLKYTWDGSLQKVSNYHVYKGKLEDPQLI
jgi:hypothetical protein